MADRQWVNRSQPQTLQGAVMFCYLNAVLSLILSFGRGYFLVLILLAVAAYGIANDRRWGYWSAVVLSLLYLLSLVIVLVVSGSFGVIIDVLFGGVLVALLLHPDSRGYQRIWFH